MFVIITKTNSVQLYFVGITHDEFGDKYLVSSLSDAMIFDKICDFPRTEPPADLRWAKYPSLETVN